MDILLKDIIKLCDANLITGNEEIICNNFSKDTRTINEGDIYVGIKGENFDGNQFYEQALEKGAKVWILQGVEIDEHIKEKYPESAIIIVDDTIKALQKIASFKRDLYNIPVIAITGSVGKTSTKDIGVPLTILGLDEHEALVVEMGMSNLGEISVLSKIAKPNIAVITNVGTSHIGNLGSIKNILKAKMEIYSYSSSKKRNRCSNHR